MHHRLRWYSTPLGGSDVHKCYTIGPCESHTATNRITCNDNTTPQTASLLEIEQTKSPLVIEQDRIPPEQQSNPHVILALVVFQPTNPIVSRVLLKRGGSTKLKVPCYINLVGTTLWTISNPGVQQRSSTCLMNWSVICGCGWIMSEYWLCRVQESDDTKCDFSLAVLFVAWDLLILDSRAPYNSAPSAHNYYHPHNFGKSKSGLIGKD